MCGRVIVSSTDVAIRARSLEVYLGPQPSAEKSEKPLKSANTDSAGAFCFMLSPGEYFVKVGSLTGSHFCSKKSGMLNGKHCY